ncbi:hypothetical protein GWI33_006492 [Rhynchophorus ferrugineus]|uniref:Uncharacterized protein n=1 Tax=Rhynchophorus ferrugineus TaxID=354439 RepID=A0A834MIX3_RHYFE|nr:hypothetical protein GWI33_006492 [Rhynchophorus ferrugineus]
MKCNFLTGVKSLITASHHIQSDPGDIVFSMPTNNLKTPPSPPGPVVAPPPSTPPPPLRPPPSVPPFFTDPLAPTCFHIQSSNGIRKFETFLKYTCRVWSLEPFRHRQNFIC